MRLLLILKPICDPKVSEFDSYKQTNNGTKRMHHLLSRWWTWTHWTTGMTRHPDGAEASSGTVRRQVGLCPTPSVLREL